MILRGMPRKRARPLDGFAALASNGGSFHDPNYDPYKPAPSTTGVTDSGSLDVGVVPFRPAAPVIYMPGQPIAPLQPQPKPYVGPPAPAGQQYVPWVIRDKTGRIVKSGYRLAPVAREAPVRREVEVEVKPTKSAAELQAELDAKLKKGREDVALAKQQQAQEWGAQVKKAAQEEIYRKYTNPYKREKALQRLEDQFSEFIASTVTQRTQAVAPGADLASVIAGVQRRYDQAVRDGASAVRSSPGISPLAPAADTGAARDTETDIIQKFAAQRGMTLRTNADFERVKEMMTQAGMVVGL